MEMILIKRDSQEWNNMWDNLSIHPINEGIDEPSVALNNGEAWQYMGSFKQDNKVIHSFRHRLHPRFQKMEQISFIASENITDDDIEKALKVN